MSLYNKLVKAYRYIQYRVYSFISNRPNNNHVPRFGTSVVLGSIHFIQALIIIGCIPALKRPADTLFHHEWLLLVAEAALIGTYYFAFFGNTWQRLFSVFEQEAKAQRRRRGRLLILFGLGNVILFGLVIPFVSYYFKYRM